MAISILFFLDLKYLVSTKLIICHVFLIYFFSFNAQLYAGEIIGEIVAIDQNKEPFLDYKNIVVYLQHKGNSLQTSKRSSYIISSKNKEFVPTLLVIPVGSKVSFENKDHIEHNVFSLSKTKAFDLGLYDSSVTKQVTFENEGIVRLYCNIHEDMRGIIVVLDTEIYSTVNENGEFILKNVPPGEYKLKFWHLSTPDIPDKLITVTEKEKTRVDVTLDLIKTVKFQHKNKWGEEYRNKY